MINPINNEEEWVEIYDAEGKRAAMHHIATVRYEEHTYFIFGAVHECDDGEEEEGLVLVRKDETEGGALQYTVTQDDAEIERVIGSFVMHTLWEHMSSSELEELLESEASDTSIPCFEQHGPMSFCFCGDPDYLQ
ncbi:MAG: DUF1292 domain-containing protein [Clostridia bacterium]|nr:DUF1292 domain-containing protein [Clostridia bacterium]